ncbi:hypothetical protein [Subtercola vilae]|uniref:Uncharacterized protein n=1 Tax=Subtercola vilae TaxID=2056433 RepID=A0A4T2BPX2_9MICO|nr:hypothetical protein [Subtercola vilae]TIH33675.1 hypothetical protein D4765_14425 [Subtercola vilae]
MLVNFPTLATGTQTINVSKIIEGRTYKVRGGVKLFAVGTAAVMDYETPPGVTITYQAEQFDVTGASLGFTSTTSIGLNYTDALISQPLNPGLVVKVRILMDSANDIVRPIPGQVVFSEGGTVGRMIGGRRHGITGMQLNVRLSSLADVATFEQMFGSYSTDYPAVLCIRTPPPLQIPRLFFAACTEPHLVIGGVNSLLTYQMSVTEVLPPAPGLVIPLLRREDIDAAYATRSARAAAYATRIQRDNDYSKAGLAG